jgi:DNA gyrase subunit A
MCIRAVNGHEDAIIATTSGIVIRISLEQVSRVGRNSIGVKIIKVGENDLVSTVSILEPDDEEQIEEVMEEITE